MSHPWSSLKTAVKTSQKLKCFCTCGNHENKSRRAGATRREQTTRQNSTSASRVRADESGRNVQSSCRIAYMRLGDLIKMTHCVRTWYRTAYARKMPVVQEERELFIGRFILKYARIETKLARLVLLKYSDLYRKEEDRKSHFAKIWIYLKTEKLNFFSYMYFVSSRKLLKLTNVKNNISYSTIQYI